MNRADKLRGRAIRTISTLVVMCFAATCHIARAQSGKVTVSRPTTTLKQALDEIGLQTDYKVAVNWNYLDPAKKITLPTGEMELTALLTQALNGTDHTWEMLGGNMIAIKYVPVPGKGRNARSALVRDDFSTSHPTFIPDPWSRTQRPFENMVNTRIARMSADLGGRDSIGMAVVNFRVNSTELERDYMDNAHALDILNRTFQRRDILSGVDYIVITAAASPEGDEAANERLAANRALAVKSYLMWKFPFLDRNMIYTFSIGEDWTGLRQLVEEDHGTPYRYEVLSLLDSNLSNASKEAGLRSIGGGRAYRYIADRMLPILRGGAALTLHYKASPKPEVVVEERIVERVVESVRTDTVFVEKLVARSDDIPAHLAHGHSARPYYMALKNNLLYDAILLPNLALEFSLPQRWSIELEGMWSWWNTDTGKHLYHRIQAGGIELRKWLGLPGRTPLTGHFVGAYGYLGNWDIRLGDTGFQCPTSSLSFGLTYGYSTPLGRRLNAEFLIGVGYFGGEYHKYTYDGLNDRYPWRSTHDLDWFGPTKAKVSLVWLIGSGKNEKKNR